MLRLVLPKGSLELATFELFAAADLTVRRASEVAYRATIDDPRIDEVHILRPQEIPTYVAEGLFDLGVTGRDWVEETGADVVSLGELRYSKATAEPDQGRARGQWRLAGSKGRGSPAGLPDLDRVPRAHQAVPGGAWSEGRRTFLLRGHRGEDSGHRGRRRRDHRDRTGTSGGGPAGDRHAHVVVHRADRESRLGCRPGEAPRWGSFSSCCRVPSRPGERSS